VGSSINSVNCFVAYFDIIGFKELRRIKGTEGLYQMYKNHLVPSIQHSAANAGQEGSVIVERLKKEPVGTGYNAATDEWVNKFEAGIVNPAKVTRFALQNAASVADMFLTTEAVIADKPDDKKMAMPDMGGMGGMM
jgi:hypothetical protein